MAWTYSRKCPWCGNRFEATQPNARFCSQNCNSSYRYWKNKNKNNPSWQAEHEAEAKEYNQEQIELETSPVELPQRKTRFDRTCAKCAEMGVSYAEWQKQDTLRKLKEWEQERKEKKNG